MYEKAIVDAKAEEIAEALERDHDIFPYFPHEMIVLLVKRLTTAFDSLSEMLAGLLGGQIGSYAVALQGLQEAAADAEHPEKMAVRTRHTAPKHTPYRVHSTPSIQAHRVRFHACATGT